MSYLDMSRCPSIHVSQYDQWESDLGGKTLACDGTYREWKGAGLYQSTTLVDVERQLG